MRKIYGTLILLMFILTSSLVNAASSKDVLYLDGSKETVDLSKLKGVTTYKKIVIKNTNLKTVPDEIYDNKQLQYLDLSNNNIRGINNKINDLTKLNTLVLRNNQIKSINKITKLSNLSYLDVSGNHLSAVNSLSDYKKLTFLDLSYNAINSIKDLSKLTKLKTLDLSNNQLIKLPKLSNKIAIIYLDQNYLNKNNDCCGQYAKKVKNQNKIVIKENVTKNQVYYVMKHKEYTNQLLISTNNKSVVEFRNYVLKFKVDNQVYSIENFIKKYKNEEKINFSILVDVVTYSNNTYSAYGSNMYQYSGNYSGVQSQDPESVGFVPANVVTKDEKKETKEKSVTSTPILVNNDDNYFNSNSFTTLSFIICLVFLIPLIMLCLVFLYIYRMNNEADKALISA